MEISAFYALVIEPIKVQHLKMTVWISVLWKIPMTMPKKWPERVVKWWFMSRKFWDSPSRTDGHIYMTFMFDYCVWRLGNCLFFHFWSSPSQLCSREKIQQKLCSESTCWVAVISSLGQALWKSIFLSAGNISTFWKTKTRHVRAFISTCESCVITLN